MASYKYLPSVKDTKLNNRFAQKQALDLRAKKQEEAKIAKKAKKAAHPGHDHPTAM